MLSQRKSKALILWRLTLCFPGALHKPKRIALASSESNSMLLKHLAEGYAFAGWSNMDLGMFFPTKCRSTCFKKVPSLLNVGSLRCCFTHWLRGQQHHYPDCKCHWFHHLHSLESHGHTHSSLMPWQ